MKSWKVFLGIALFVAAVPLFAQNMNISMGNKHGDPQTCADITISIGDGPTIRTEQTMNFAANEVQTLAFDSTSHTGIHVTGWDQNEYSVVACKAAGGSDEGDAKRTLDQVQLQRNGGTLSLAGPGTDDPKWVAVLLVKAPRKAALNLKVKNGPLTLNGMSGSGVLEAKNGPISLKDSDGQFEINTKNGPISINGRAGKLKLTAHNGPIEVNVSGDEWTGELSGEAYNGPIELMLPRKFNSGVEVTNSHGPMQCNADACQGQTYREDGGERRLKLGTTDAVIHLSTENGPVMVVNRKTL